MFFGIKRIAPNLEHLILHSIGDNLDTTGNLQDIQVAEVFLEKKIDSSKISVEALTNVIKDPAWHIRFTCSENAELKYEIIIDKKSDHIISREYTTLP